MSRPNRSTIPSLPQAMALLTAGNLHLAILRMSKMAESFHDSGDDATADLFAAFVVELGDEQQRRREAEEAIRIEIDDLDIGGLVSESDE